MLMELIRKHYPWVIKNPKSKIDELEHFDLSKDDEIQLMLLKHTKFSEIPQFYCDGKLVGGLEMLENLHE